ncbi:MAG: ribose 1,5-bisphosphate isomerase, partial [Methanomassiliicoccales archaeon]|nr:ribose 1,5-bisphosphate isomerase [Methanomassiliicoccales archaeon]
MDIEEIAELIRSMKIRGAGEIARTAAQALKDLAISYNGNDIDQFRSLIQKGKDILLSTRPTAVSLWNAVHSVLKNVKNFDSVDELKSLITKNADNFISKSREAVRIIGEIGAKRINSGDCILTHCNSKAALSVIKT